MNNKLLILFGVFLCLGLSNAYADFNLNSSTDYFVVIQANSINQTAFLANLSNISIYNLTPTTFIIYDNQSSNLEVRRANVMATLFYGTDGSDARLKSLYVNNVSKINPSLVKDNNMYGFYIETYAVETFESTNGRGHTTLRIFGNTSGVESNMSVWSNLVLDGYVNAIYSPTFMGNGSLLIPTNRTIISLSRDIAETVPKNNLTIRTNTSGFDYNGVFGYNQSVTGSAMQYGGGDSTMKTILLSTSKITNSSFSEIHVCDSGSCNGAGGSVSQQFIDFNTLYNIPRMQFIGFNNTELNNFLISTRNIYDYSPVNNINITLSNSTYSQSFLTSNGYVNTGLNKSLGGLYNISVYGVGQYFNQTFSDYNVSNNLDVNLYQSVVSLNNCTEKVSGIVLTCVNNNTIYPNAGVYNFTNSVTGYYNVTKQFTINYLDNKTLLFDNFYTSNLTLKSVSAYIGTLTNCTYTLQGITYPSYSEIVYGNPNSSVGLINGSYTIQNNCLGFATNTQNITINSASQNITFSVYTTNSINLTFININNNSVITGTNLTVKFIGGTQQTNVTSTGNLYVDLLSPSDYTITTSGAGFLTNTYLLTLINQTYNPIIIYMTPNSTLTYYILFTVIDKLSRQPIQGATVTIQHYINNAWVTEQIYTTDFNGRGQGYFIINTDYYNFVITYNGVVYSGALNNDANKKIMFYQDYLDGLGIEISLSQTNYINTLQGIDSAQTGLRYQSVTNNSGNFIYNFLDTLGQSRNWTLMVYNGNNLNCSTSVYTSSGNLACLISNNGSEQWFQAYTFIDGIPDKATSERIGVNDAWDFEWGIGGWIFTIFIVIIAFTSFAQVPSISIMIGSAFFALALFFNVIFTRSANVSQLGIVIVFIAFLLAKIPSNSGVNS